jgi:hypothetical protein
MRNTCKISVGKPEGRIELDRYVLRRANTSKIDITEKIEILRVHVTV